MKLVGAPQEYPHYPVCLHNAYPNAATSNPTTDQGTSLKSGSLAHEASFVAPANTIDATAPEPPLLSHPSILRNRGRSTTRNRGESIAQIGKRVDFSLGISSISSGADFGDVYEDRKFVLPPTIKTTSSSPAPVRASEDGSSLIKSTSRDSSGMSRILSNSSSNRTHRNRFFSRRPPAAGIGTEGRLKKERGPDVVLWVSSSVQ